MICVKSQSCGTALSTLRGLKIIIEAIIGESEVDKSPPPCDLFDEIGGTGSGHLIAIMLVRLRMVTLCFFSTNAQSVDECIEFFIAPSERTLYAGRTPIADETYPNYHNILESLIKKVVKEELFGGSVPEVDNQVPECVSLETWFTIMEAEAREREETIKRCVEALISLSL